MKKLFFVCILFFVSFAAQARRTSPGQFFGDVYGTYTFTSFGAGLSFGGYTRLGYWYGGASYENNSCVLSNGKEMDFPHVFADGGYMFRFLSSRSHSVNLYGGAGGFLGAELVDPSGKIEPSGKISPSGKVYATTFLYGFYPELTAEFFPFGAVAFFLDMRIPVNFVSIGGHFFYHFSAGVRFNF